MQRPPLPRLPRVLGAVALCVSLPLTACGDGDGEVRAEGFDDPVIEETISRLAESGLESAKGGALSVAIVHEDDVVFLGGYGTTPDGDPPDGDTLFRAASVSKLFTAVSVMQLHEDGVIDIDAPLADQLPGFSVQSRFDGARPITPRDLLTHRSGLPSDSFGPFREGEEERFSVLLDRVAAAHVAHPPGEWWSYSNVGFSLLGLLVEEASGLPFETYVEEHIFSPCGMDASVWDPSASIPGTLQGAPLDEGPLWRLALPAGALVSSVSDLSRFASGILAGGACPKGRILEEGTLSAMLEEQPGPPIDLDFSMGLAFWREPDNPAYGGFTAVGHNGDSLLQHAVFKLIPELDVGVVAMTNEAAATDLIDEVVGEALRLAIAAVTKRPVAAPPRLPDPAWGTPFSDDELDEMAGSYGSSMGVLRLERAGNGFHTTLAGAEVALVPTDARTFRVQPRVGFLNLPLTLEGMELSVQKVEGEWTLYARGPSVSPSWMLMGARVPEGNVVNDAWRARAGRWEAADDDDGWTARLEQVELAEREGYLESVWTVAFPPGPVTLSFALLPINDHEAVVAGRGRMLGETVRVEEGPDGEEVLVFMDLRAAYVGPLEDTSGGCAQSPIASPPWLALTLGLALLARRRRRGRPLQARSARGSGARRHAP